MEHSDLHVCAQVFPDRAVIYLHEFLETLFEVFPQKLQVRCA